MSIRKAMFRGRTKKIQVNKVWGRKRFKTARADCTNRPSGFVKICHVSLSDERKPKQILFNRADAGNRKNRQFLTLKFFSFSLSLSLAFATIHHLPRLIFSLSLASSHSLEDPTPYLDSRRCSARGSAEKVKLRDGFSTDS